MIKEYPSHNVDICLISTNEVTIGIRSLSSFLKQKGYRVLLGFFNSCGMYTEQEIKHICAWINTAHPAVIGISSLECSREKSIQLFSALKKEGIVLVVGGPDVTLNPECYLAYVDYAIRGEGEYALDELIDALRSGRNIRDIANVCYRAPGGAIIANDLRPLIQDLDEIPHEDWLDRAHHFKLVRGVLKEDGGFVLSINDPMVPYNKSIWLFTIRGCSLMCSYCTNAQSNTLNPHEKYVRKRSIESVVKRVEQLLAADSSVEMVYFFEDDFFVRTDNEIQQFCSAWKSRIRLPFYAQGTPLTVTENKYTELLDAGLVLVRVGIQTGSENINYSIYNRKVSNDAAIKTATLLHSRIGAGRFGFRAPCYDFIINNPYETYADLLETIYLLKRLPKPFFICMPSLSLFQGTALHKKAVADGILSGRDETTKFNFYDTLQHFDYLVRRGGNYYLNSLLYWMNGVHTEKRGGIIPSRMIDWLVRERTINYCNRNPHLITCLNQLLPTYKRAQNIKANIYRLLSIS
ncbi:MAG: radical SAM protein [Elusimicrobia bacterium]|nr:radical SAM protein [Elusimicrobiota bacterium]